MYTPNLRKVVGKKRTWQSQLGNLGYDQWILISQINTSSPRCLHLLLSFITRKHTSMEPSPGTMNLKLPTIPFGIVACAFFRQPFSKQLYNIYEDLHPIPPNQSQLIVLYIIIYRYHTNFPISFVCNQLFYSLSVRMSHICMEHIWKRHGGGLAPPKTSLFTLPKLQVKLIITETKQKPDLISLHLKDPNYSSSRTDYKLK